VGHDPLRLILEQPAEVVAPQLLGWQVRANGVTVRLTEVEAYSGSGRDPGSHAHRGPTPRSAIMFGPPGRLYVYFSYGMHWCANVVTGPDGEASAVLLRAGEVVEGLETARSRRGSARDRDLCRGPARLAQALGLDRSHLGVDVLDPGSPVRLLRGSHHGRVLSGPRVGLSVGQAIPWRFWLADEPTVSPYRPGKVRS
jgi:DNA-3-methyladenine glycosylase